MFAYSKAMRTTKPHLPVRYFNYFGNVLEAWGTTGGQQGDPLEMIKEEGGDGPVFRWQFPVVRVSRYS